MTITEAMHSRHAVRSYVLRPLKEETAAALRTEIDRCNRESGLHIRLITGEPEAFSGFRARRAGFSGVSNYLVLAGKRSRDLEERAGYYGQRLALYAQTLGLNTCWAAGSFRRGKCPAEPGETLVCAIAVGCGATAGHPHASRSVDSVCRTDRPIPAWFRLGVEAALLAPTARNRQNFQLTLRENEVSLRTGGPCAGINRGILKCQFELGAGGERFRWADAAEKSGEDPA
jgi:hypothetical protein